MPRAESKKWTDRRDRVVRFILPILKKTYPTATCSLDFGTPLQLLVATILSAQCTDERVNAVTKTLFKKYRSADDYARVPPEQFERDIQSTGFFRNKTKSIRGMAQALVCPVDPLAGNPFIGEGRQRELVGCRRGRLPLRDFRRDIWRKGRGAANDRRAFVGDDDFAGIKRAVNDTTGMSGIERAGENSNSGD